MIILTTTLLYYVMDKSGVAWEGVAAAWILAAMLDTGIVCFYIYAKYIHK